MNKAFELRGFAEAMHYLSDNERRQAQGYYDSLLDGRTQQSPPRARLFPAGQSDLRNNSTEWRA